MRHFVRAFSLASSISLLFAFDSFAAKVERGPASPSTSSVTQVTPIQSRCQSSTVWMLQRLVDDGIAQAEDYVCLGHAHLVAKDGKAAKRAFKSAVELGAKAAGHNGLGLVSWNNRNGGMQAIFQFRRALAEDPTFVDAQFNLAAAYQKLRPRDAMAEYEKVVALDPQHRDAYYRIGQQREKIGETDQAITAYETQIRVNPTHVRAKYRMGKIAAARGQLRKAGLIFGELTTAGGDVEAWSYLEMAVLNYRIQKLDRAQRFFEAYIKRLPEEERWLYRDISRDATKKQMVIYKNTSDDKKEEMASRFWDLHDPTPLTAVNERLVEHYLRVATARKKYSSGEFPWDARGEVYIRLGRPDHVSSWNNVRTEADPGIQLAREKFSNRVSSDFSASPGLPLFPMKHRWEYWVYPELEGGVEFTFENRFAGFND